MRNRCFLLTAVCIVSLACKSSVETKNGNHEAGRYRDPHDHHSYANPEQIRVSDVALDLNVSFADKTLKGICTLKVERQGNDTKAPLVLDSRDLKVTGTESSNDGKTFSPVQFQTGRSDSILGAPLTIQLPVQVSHVRISYQTSPGASALQWLTPPQTAGKKHPFLYTQSQAIHARSWIPLQDTPGVRATYSARIRTDRGLRAVMSANNQHTAAPTGEYSFVMPQAIPSYLIALAVGDLDYKAISNRTGVYAEPSVLPRAAREFEDMEKMVQAAEQIYGRYQWDQYDVLILPPSFPYGGMENPRLTFLTPTLLAGDKSLVGVVSHELAHSWSGNLVTNATWRDFWLNEGFTTYFERRIQEQVYGRPRSEMEALLEKREAEAEMKQLPERDQILYIDLKGRDPDEGSTRVPYVKGMLFLRRLEELYGRDRFDSFLKGYFRRFAFRSITTGDFVEYLQEHLLKTDAALAEKVGLEEWLTRPGWPATTPEPRSTALDEVAGYARSWVRGSQPLAAVPVKAWSAAEWQHFLASMPDDLSSARMVELDQTFHFTQNTNSEIKFQWLMMSIRSRYEPAMRELDRFLIEVGRRKYIRPLYTELAKTPGGLEHARAVYARARPGYHPISAATIDEVLKGAPAQGSIKK